MSDCSHRIVYMKSSERCKQPSAICDENCMNGSHPGDHFYISIEEIENKIGSWIATLTKQQERNKKQIQQLYRQSSDQLQARYKESMNQIQNEFNLMKTGKNADLLKKIENKRWQKIVCSELNSLKDILKDNGNYKWEKAKKIVDEFKKYTTTSCKGAFTKLRNQNQKLKDQIKSLKEPNHCEKGMIKMDVKHEEEIKLRKENIRLKTQNNILGQRIAFYKKKCGEIEENDIEQREDQKNSQKQREQQKRIEQQKRRSEREEQRKADQQRSFGHKFTQGTSFQQLSGNFDQQSKLEREQVVPTVKLQQENPLNFLRTPRKIIIMPKPKQNKQKPNDCD